MARGSRKAGRCPCRPAFPQPRTVRHPRRGKRSGGLQTCKEFVVTSPPSVDFFLDNARSILEDALHDDYPFMIQTALRTIYGLVDSCDVLCLDIAIHTLSQFPDIDRFRLNELICSLESAMPDSIPVVYPKFDYDQFYHLWKCKHPTSKLTRRIIKNGQRKALQCTICGTMLSTKFSQVHRQAIITQLPGFDLELPKQWGDWRRFFTSNAVFVKNQWYARWKENWWERYQDYLDSDAWKTRRQHVLARSQNRCERCGAAAEVVHHLSYEHMGHEPLTDLMALCYLCHHHEHGTIPLIVSPS